ncbi:aminophospholipid translocase, partial [Bonamia ostreae]
QASRAADFSISKFKNLKHLILHHGSQNYPRIATLINFNFYKNIAITVIIFAYFVYSGYSNNIIIPQDSLSFHNLFYTNVPMFAVSISNSSFSRKIIFKWPHLYKRGSENRMLNYTTLFVYLFLAIENGMVVYLLNLYIFDASFIGSNGMGLPSCYVS